MKFRMVPKADIQKTIVESPTEGLYLNYFNLSQDMHVGATASEDEHGENYDDWCAGCQANFDAHADVLELIANEVLARRSGVPAGATVH